MVQLNKIMGHVGLVMAFVSLPLMLAGVISTDAYSLAAQTQARGDFALMQSADNTSRVEHGDNTALQFTESHERQVTTQ
ncbi:hypothetical protein [Solimicrobium silvestre]|uniref:Uncharacterized protein n=1 Tax=Solimicrobium silvestre TaxID=2099400 RepID=A0A2S9GSN6_9BURK|nr:hypothetical protein [Solimicrobium silvestre]PRC90721.1 hypothetical protein S2091_4547 [Solimicrobium silvestre]